MLAKCANPTCSTPLIYLREGKVFMVENPAEPRIRPRGPVLAKPKPGGRVEHFWLCDACASQWTLMYDSERGITLLPLRRRPLSTADADALKTGAA